MNATQKAIIDNFPGPSNRGIRERLRKAAQDGSRTQVLALRYSIALTACGESGVQAVADTLKKEQP